jgi:hypothetical protein
MGSDDDEDESSTSGSDDDKPITHATFQAKTKGKKQKSIIDRSNKYSNNWLLIVRKSKILHAFTWKRMLKLLGMSLEALAEYVDEENDGERGAFCVFKTPRKISMMTEKIGNYCIVKRLDSKFADNDVKYKDLQRRGLLVIDGAVQASLRY